VRRPAPPREIPPPLELECLKTLWKIGEASVKDVQADLAASRGLAYTTVMTLLDRLARKGAAARRKVGRQFLYSAVLPREAVRRAAIGELVEGLFDGSQTDLAAFLQGRVEAPPAATQPPDDKLDTALL
jgi:BlaI family transcriptional regulator, penicillinase repressor